MSDLATELRAIGHAINHDEYVDAGVVPLTLAHAADRIEALEAGLREIKDQYLTPEQSSAIARKALAPASAALQRDKPAREENDDVFPGFRGNNDYA